MHFLINFEEKAANGNESIRRSEKIEFRNAKTGFKNTRIGFKNARIGFRSRKLQQDSKKNIAQRRKMKKRG